MLRLLALGAAPGAPPKPFRRRFVAELLTAFFESPLSDPFTQKLILQVSPSNSKSEQYPEPYSCQPWPLLMLLKCADHPSSRSLWGREGMEPNV